MSSLLSLNTGYVDVFLWGNKISPKISLREAHKSIQDKTCTGCEYLGWVDLPENTNDEIISEIQAYSESLQSSTDVLIVCGIGGSYLGARALIEALSNWTKSEVVFLGNHLSGLEYDVSIVVPDFDMIHAEILLFWYLKVK